MKSIRDRFGNERCGGYSKEDFSICDLCVPTCLVENAKLDTGCWKCGGYGEFPRETESVTITQV